MKKESIKKLERDILRAVTGPGFRARVKAEQALPNKFKADDGVIFNPEWQDDIVSDKELREWRKKHGK